MSNEITVTSNISVRKVHPTTGRPLIDFRRSASVVADLTGVRGPSPGSVLARLASDGGTQVDLSHLTRPTWCWLANQGPADASAPADGDYVTVGVWNAQDTSFAPLLELAPGEGLVVKLSRDLQEIYQGPGTGTAGAGETARLMVVANSRQQIVLVEAVDF